MIPGDQTAAELVPVAINNRPEIASQRELLAAANMRLKQEKKRPFLPNLIATSPSTATGLLAAGNLSAGPNAGLGANGILRVSSWRPSGSCRMRGSATSAASGNDRRTEPGIDRSDADSVSCQGRGDPGPGPAPNRPATCLRQRRDCGRQPSRPTRTSSVYARRRGQPVSCFGWSFGRRKTSPP